MDPVLYEKAIEEIVPEDARRLFVVDFGNLKEGILPLFVVYRLADTAVPFEDSDKLVAKTKSFGGTDQVLAIGGAGSRV